MEDERIVALYWERSEQAIAETEKKYDRYLEKIAHNILNNLEDSRESVNDTYLAKLTRRISIDRFRYRIRDKRAGSEYAISLSELSDCVSGGNTAEEIVNAKALADAIGVYLRLQSKETQAAFLGRYYFLDPVKEIAAYLGMSESKVKSLLYRTRLGLKEYLEKEGFCL